MSVDTKYIASVEKDIRKMENDMDECKDAIIALQASQKSMKKARKLVSKAVARELDKCVLTVTWTIEDLNERVRDDKQDIKDAKEDIADERRNA